MCGLLQVPKGDISHGVGDATALKARERAKRARTRRMLVVTGVEKGTQGFL